LRQRGYLPILFDFEKPRGPTSDETVTLLARMVRFVIADISDAKSVLQELRAIVSDLPSLAVQPLILSSQEEPGIFDFFRRYPWVLATHRYEAVDRLMADLTKHIIGPAERKVQELRDCYSAFRAWFGLDEGRERLSASLSDLLRIRTRTRRSRGNSIRLPKSEDG